MAPTLFRFLRQERDLRTFELSSAIWLPRPIDAVFPFFADAHNLQEITPPFLRFELLTPRPISMAKGTLIDYKLRVRGLPLRWRSEITAWEPPHRFVDEQIKGPYRMWVHEHRFRERAGGTLCEDRVQYAVPGGAWIHRLFVEREVQAIFAYRKKRLGEIFKAGGGAEHPAA